MKKSIYLSFALVGVFILMSLAPVKDDKAKPKFQRVVCFKFKAGTSAEAKTKHMNEFAAFVKAIPQVLSYRAGKTVKGESKTESEYDALHYLTFEKEQDIITYDTHAAHKQFVESNKANWENVISVNAAIEK